MIFSIFSLAVGSILLYYGAELMVNGGSGIARKFGVSSLVIGLTIVAFSTSLPELLVSLKASLENSSPIAIGNAVGSNIANVGLVLGLSSLIYPISINYKNIKRDLWVYLFACLLFILFILDGRLSQFEGSILFTSLIFYILICIKKPVKKESDLVLEENNLSKFIIYVIGGIACLTVGADLFVDGSIFIARYFGLSEVVIGMSIVAFGTSLPELATSIMAAFRKEVEISVGNIIGSNIFNILCVLGLTSIFKPLNAQFDLISHQLIIMVLFGIVLFVLSKGSQPLNKFSSSSLLISYFIFIYLLF